MQITAVKHTSST